jgi:hypothetical protein
VAVAVNEDGKREVLGVARGPSEAEVFWVDFLLSLADRGLRGVKLVIADDRKRIRAAARRVFDATRQRCRVRLLKKSAPGGSSWRPGGLTMGGSPIPVEGPRRALWRGPEGGSEAERRAERPRAASG